MKKRFARRRLRLFLLKYKEKRNGARGQKDEPQQNVGVHHDIVPDRPFARDVNRRAVRMKVREAEHQRRQDERNDDGGRLRALAYKESLHAAITSSHVMACGR